MLEQQDLDIPGDRRQAVLEVGGHRRFRAALAAAVHPVFALVGEQPGQGDQDEVREQFLFHRALALAVEVLDAQGALADLEQLLDAPSSMVEGREVFDAGCLRIEQRRRQREAGAPGGVLDQPQAERPEAGARVFGAQGAQGVPARRDLGHAVGAVAGKERVEGAAGLRLQPEHRMQAPRRMRVQQFAGIVAAVVHHDVAFPGSASPADRRTPPCGSCPPTPPRPGAPTAMPDVPPIGRPVAGALKPHRVDKSLHQHRTVAVLRRPVLRKPPQRHRQRLRSQALHPDPR